MLSLMHGISLNTLPLMNIFMMLQGAGVKCRGQVCVCALVLLGKRSVKGVRGKPFAQHQNKQAFCS